jgi:hypoxanthine phosphoribosyltransferase
MFALMQEILLHDKKFRLFIENNHIQESIAEMAQIISKDYQDKKPLFIAVLNGSFMFAADLIKQITIECEISFVKVASYHGSISSGSVAELIGLAENVQDRNIIVLEDIVDTGTTLQKIIELLNYRKPQSIKVASLLFKPDAYKKSIPVDYTAIVIPNRFIVGYGLDYKGLGRNLPDIYELSE